MVCGRERVDRRTVLRSTGAAAGIGLLNVAGLETVSASDGEYHLGKTLFVETAVEHPDAPDFPLLESDGRAPYAVDGANDRVTIIAADAQPFERNPDAVAADGHTVASLPADVSGSEGRSSLVRTTDYRGLHRQLLRLEEPYRSPAVRLRRVGGDRVEATVAGNHVEVGPESESEILVGPRQVKVRRRSRTTVEVPNPREKGPDMLERAVPGPVESEQVTPVVKVRNRGRLDVYGGSDVRVYPLHSDDNYSNSMIRAIEKHQARRAVQDSDSDLLVVRTGGGR